MDTKKVTKHGNIGGDFRADGRHRGVLNGATATGEHVLEATKNEGDPGSWWRSPHVVRHLRNQGNTIWSATSLGLNSIGEYGLELTGSELQRGPEVGVE